MERDATIVRNYKKHFNFNSHAHVERDDILSDCLNDGEDFNSHAHVERDPFKIKKENIVYNFNSHAHVERD